MRNPNNQYSFFFKWKVKYVIVANNRLTTEFDIVCLRKIDALNTNPMITFEKSLFCSFCPVKQGCKDQCLTRFPGVLRPWEWQSECWKAATYDNSARYKSFRLMFYMCKPFTIIFFFQTCHIKTMSCKWCLSLSHDVAVDAM